MNIRLARFAVPILTVVLLSACAALDAGAPVETPQHSPTPADETPQPPGDEDMSGVVPDELIRQILADAVQRSGIGENEIEIVTAEAVTWSDGSLGCPEPGMGYTQALVDGYRVVIDAAGDELHYHTAEAGHFLYCEEPESEGMPRS